MASESPVEAGLEYPALQQNGPDPQEVALQLERITASHPFRNSKRYPAFLRYVVEHTLAGDTGSLKERTLGIEVFGRALDYDTNADPVVRITAGETRKRLAQYYQTPGRAGELRIELPVGSYVPVFGAGLFVQEPKGTLAATVAAEEAEDDVPLSVDSTPAHDIEDGAEQREAVEPVSPVRADAGSQPAAKRAGLWIVPGLVALVVVIGAVVGVGRLRSARAEKRENAGEVAFWAPALQAEGTPLIVIGVHSLGEDGKDHASDTPGTVPKEQQTMLSMMSRNDMVPVSDIVSYGALTRVLDGHGREYRTQGSSETTFEQLQRGPVVLLGGLDNVWTLRLTAPLRFHFQNAGSVATIVDRQQPAAGWSFDNAQKAGATSRDYALVASFRDAHIEQPVVIAAGIGQYGTAAATAFLSNKHLLAEWVEKNGGAHKNVELVLSTEIVDGQSGPPHVIAATSW